MGWWGSSKAPDMTPVAEATRYAADKQYEASMKAIDLWKKQQEQAREDLRPWREMGLKALNYITAGMESGEFEAKMPKLPTAPKAPDFSGVPERTEAPTAPTMPDTVALPNLPTPVAAPGALPAAPERPDLPDAPVFDETTLPTPVDAPVIPGFKAPEESKLPKWKGFSFQDMKRDAGYQWRLEEGLRAVQASAAAGSGLASGGTLKALTMYGQNYASKEFGKARARAVQDYEINTARAKEIYGRAVGEYGMEVNRIQGQYSMDRQEWADKHKSVLDRYGAKRQSWLDERGNLIAGYEMDRQNWQDRRANIIDKYGMDRQAWADQYKTAMDDYGVRRQDWADRRSNLLTDYNMERVKWLDDRMRINDMRGDIMQQYGVDRQHWADTRTSMIDDYNLRQAALNRHYNRLASQAGVGQMATNQILQSGQTATSNIAHQMMQGAKAQGAGEVGAQNAIVQGHLWQMQADQQQFNNFMAIAGLALGGYTAATSAGTAATATAASDRRLKTDIEKLTTLPNGINLYSFRWKGAGENSLLDIGVIAQEVQEVMPEAVFEDRDGFLTVDYVKVLAK